MENWIETEARAAHRTSWAVICDGKLVHSEEQSGDDPAGAKAFEAALRWAEVHCPGIGFHWRHRSLAAAAGRPAEEHRA